MCDLVTTYRINYNWNFANSKSININKTIIYYQSTTIEEIAVSL